MSPAHAAPLPALARRLATLLALACAVASAPAAAQSPAASLRWHCWPGPGDRLSCVQDAIDAADADASAAPAASPAPSTLGSATSAAPAATGTRVGVMRASVRPLPPIVAQLRERPHELAGQVVTIPVFSPSDDWARLELLARSVLCGTRADCGVRLNRSLVAALDAGLDTDRLFVGPDFGASMPPPAAR